MQTHSSFLTAFSSSSRFPYQKQIPWWSDISPEVLTELTLAPIESVEQREFDVVVVGGGVAGLSAALGARRSGATVLLLEKESHLGYGATGRNAGILSAGINMSIADTPLGSPERAFWRQTTTVLHQLIAESQQEGSLLEAKLTGSLTLAESTHAAKHVSREAHQRQIEGLNAELWSAAQTAEYTVGRLNTHDVMQALWLPDEGRVQPLTLLAHLAHKARNAGVVLCGNAEVSTYQETHALWHISLLDGRRLSAERIIYAVGPTHAPTARIYALAFALELPDGFPLFWDASPYTYADYRPGNGRLGVSGGRYGRAGNSKNDERFYQSLIRSTAHWLPELAEQIPSYRWAVNLYISTGLIPQLRTLGEHLPGMAIEGLGSLGVLPGIVLGERAGQQMTE